MNIQFKYVLYVVIFTVSHIDCFSQNLSDFNYDQPDLKAYFRHEDLQIEPDETFFNVLNVVNRSNMPHVVVIDFNAPVGWTVIKEEKRNYTIEGGDTLLIPIRVAATKDVRGEIGYSIIASVNDRYDHTLANAYCYVKIPSRSNLRFRPITRVSYFDLETSQSILSFNFENQGNIDELIFIELRSTDNVILPNEENNSLLFDVRLESGKDTTITIPVLLEQDQNELNNQSLFRVDLEATTDERRFTTTFWFRHLANFFRYEIPPGEIPLIAEAMIHNLFSEYDPYFSGAVQGNILFRRDRNISYRFRAYGIGRTDDFLDRSRFRVSYNAPVFNVIIGDLTGMPLKHGLGRGLKLNYRFFNRYEIKGIAAENPYRPIRNYGGIFNARWAKLGLHTRFATTENRWYNSDANIYGVGTNLALFKNHHITLDAGLSDVTFNEINQQEIGYGFRVNYSGRINNIRIRLNEQFGTTNYYGHYAGRHNFLGTINYRYRERLLFDLIFYDRVSKPVVESTSGIFSDRFHSTRRANLRTTRYMDTGFAYFFGPIYERRGSNAFFHFNGDDPFITNSAKFEIGARIRESHLMFFNPSLSIGYSFVTSFSEPDNEANIHYLDDRKQFFSADFSFNMKSGNWGAFLNYFYGPYALNQQLVYFYQAYFTQSIRIMPYYETFIYRNIVKLSSRLNFMHDFTFKTTRLHMHNELDFYLPKGFTVSFLNTLGYQMSTDLITEDKYDYSSTYFEIRLKKDFYWNQPRVKYYDMTVHLFKDLNGNLRKDPNEPGVNNVLVTIYREDTRYYDEFEKEYEFTGQLVNNKLLSGMDGTVTYENLAAGLYRIVINSMDKRNGTFVPDVTEMIVHVNKDKNIYVPFLERNKIFGKVILNRSKLSTLGRIDVSNIRVTATDARGNTLSTLTDGQGKFEIYAPSLDDYVVSIRDIFEDHFTLRQNNFVVHLNAYKKFEVNFVFDERRRRIDFYPSEADVDAEVMTVRRTNLSGYVKDRMTLQPLRATIEIVDNRTGRTIETTRSDRNTGRFNTSFMTGENYSLILVTPGYWLYSEKLDLEPTLTIQDVEMEVLLENIIVGSKIELRNLVFDSGSDEIPTEAYPELDRLIEQLKENPNVRIQIAGHSDALETMDFRGISNRRAEAVARYMFEQGVGNIEYVGYEDRRPVAPDDTEENRARNRRVEITIIDK